MQNVFVDLQPAFGDFLLAVGCYDKFPHNILGPHIGNMRLFQIAPFDCQQAFADKTAGAVVQHQRQLLRRRRHDLLPLIGVGSGRSIHARTSLS